jgi:hypothetical protein
MSNNKDAIKKISIKFHCTLKLSKNRTWALINGHNDCKVETLLAIVHSNALANFIGQKKTEMKINSS